MATLQAADIADLITTTQRDLGKMRWTEIATDLQEHVAMSQILNKEKVQFGSGQAIQWNVMTGTSGASKNVGLYEVDQVNVADVMTTATIPWRHTTTNYAIERREIAMNRSPAAIVSLVKVRRSDALIDLAGLMETNFWNDPANDNLTPFGVPYWAAYTSGTDGFLGGNPTNYTGGAGGLDTATFPRWNNYCFTYTSVTKTSAVREWRRAATFTGFKSPLMGLPGSMPDYNRGNRYGYYTNYNVIGPLEEALEAQNMNLGNDIASKDGQLVFRQNPVVWVPQLENATGDPIYGLNWGVFYPCFLSGEYMHEEGPAKASNQHTVFQTHIDMTYNFKCTNRRLIFVGRTA